MDDALLTLKVEPSDKECCEHDIVRKDDPLCQTDSVVLGKFESNVLKCCG